MKKYILFSILSLVLISCHAISPSLQMPKENLKQGDFNIQPGFEVLPETDYSAFSSDYSGGYTCFFRYGAADFLTPQIKVWIPNHNYYDNFRWGFAVMPIIYLNPKDENKFFVVPTMNFLQNEFDFNYSSVGIYTGASFQKILWVYPYGAISIHKAFSWNSDVEKGMVATANGGVNLPIWDWLDISLELTYTMMNTNTNNFYSTGTKYFLTPSFSLGFNF